MQISVIFSTGCFGFSSCVSRGLVREVRFKFLQVGFCGNSVDGHYLYHPAVEFTVPDVALGKGLNLKASMSKSRASEGCGKNSVVDVINLETRERNGFCCD